MINQSNTHDLFFGPNTVKDFPSVLNEVQEYISSKYASLLLDSRKDDVKQQIKFYIQKYLADNRVTADGMTEEEFKEEMLLLSKELEKINSEARSLEERVLLNLQELFNK